MAGRPCVAEPSSELMVNFPKVSLKNKLRSNLNPNIDISLRENTLENKLLGIKALYSLVYFDQYPLEQMCRRLQARIFLKELLPYFSTRLRSLHKRHLIVIALIVGWLLTRTTHDDLQCVLACFRCMNVDHVHIRDNVSFSCHRMLWILGYTAHLAVVCTQILIPYCSGVISFMKYNRFQSQDRFLLTNMSSYVCTQNHECNP